MGTIAARTFERILDNLEGALACELLCALAATDFRRPLRSGAGTQAAYDIARTRIAPMDGDRVTAPDIVAGREIIASFALASAAERAAGCELR
jgi:histidine ammonia-lyase